ncbi:MAG: hypothetical protein ACFFDT_11825 [Candidatus Hodarchaeota archaeon]
MFEKNNGKRVAFVISPIGEPDSAERKRADQILKHVIKPVVSEFGYEAIRADNIPKPGIITSQVINHIINDPLVIADLAGHNPNVFYELAIRHAIKKPVIQIIRKDEKIPFDVSIQRTIQIDHKDLDSVDEAKKELKKQIKAVEKDPTLVNSPISTAVNLESMKQSSDPERKAIAEFRSTLQELYIAVKEIQNQIEDLKEKSPLRYSVGRHLIVDHDLRPTEHLVEHIEATPRPYVVSSSDIEEITKNIEDYLSKRDKEKKRRAKKDQ